MHLLVPLKRPAQERYKKVNTCEWYKHTALHLHAMLFGSTALTAEPESLFKIVDNRHTIPTLQPTHLRAVPFGSTPLAARPEPSPPTLNSMPVPSTRVALLSFSVSSTPSNPRACKRGRGKGGGEAHAQATRQTGWTVESGDRARW